MRWNGFDHETAYSNSVDLPSKLHVNAIFALGKAPSDRNLCRPKKEIWEKMIFFPTGKMEIWYLDQANTSILPIIHYEHYVLGTLFWKKKAHSVILNGHWICFYLSEKKSIYEYIYMHGWRYPNLGYCECNSFSTFSSINVNLAVLLYAFTCSILHTPLPNLFSLEVIVSLHIYRI